jgi:predicted glycosyl hydrolase (DUF1957 family)
VKVRWKIEAKNKRWPVIQQAKERRVATLVSKISNFEITDSAKQNASRKITVTEKTDHRFILSQPAWRRKAPKEIRCGRDSFLRTIIEF